MSETTSETADCESLLPAVGPASKREEEVSWTVLEEQGTEEQDTEEQGTAELWLRKRHRSMLLISVVILFLSVVFAVRDSGEQATIVVFGQVMPGLCASRMWFGVECPGCGLTRSFVSLAAGDFATSFHFHRIGWLMFAAVALQIPYRIVCLRELRSGAITRRWPEWFGRALILALIGNWVLKFFLK